ncbi:MAG TPA: efflux RND transporter periplasmic adaptor subunit [Candidatus Dormibacteraeota bacterium]|nr:efflux RND transporter periplasmic adaptor subunit [Candidatus Dormibacteraeota bacterium]
MPSTARYRFASIVVAFILGGLTAVGVASLYRGRHQSGLVASSGVKAVYHCPMHPSMQSDRPADCPICGMRMVPVETAGATRAPMPKRVIYRSTMNPSEVSDKPGKDSMGMEMVPVEMQEQPEETPRVEGHAVVSIPATRQRLIGVRTQVVEKAPFIREIRALGRVAVDETRLHHVHTKVGGWIETLYAHATGEKVVQGQPLLSIYSPELVASQEEFLVALRGRNALGEGVPPEAVQRADELLESARRRLLLLDLTPGQIHHLTETGEASRDLTLYAPMSGYVLARNVTHGERIEANTALLDIADLSRVWVLAAVYEYEVPFVKVGQPATMTLSYLPGKVLRGRVGLVYPVLDAATRTVQVRLEFPNPGLQLKPEMYADVELESDLGQRLIVPETAVLATGTRDIVFVDRGDGAFEPREVRLGLRLPEAVEVLAGLAEGERIVTSGNFLVDSESRLKAALESAARPAPLASPEGGTKEP